MAASVAKRASTNSRSFAGLQSRRGLDTIRSRAFAAATYAEPHVRSQQMSLEDRDGHIWLDGQLIPWRDARVHILSYTFQHGAGVFEGTRAYHTERGTSVFRLHDHIERLFASAKILQIPLEMHREHLCHAHLDVIRANSLSQCYLRTNVYYDGKIPGVSAQGNDVHVSIAAWEWNAYLG